jgi:hypothetical protein
MCTAEMRGGPGLGAVTSILLGYFWLDSDLYFVFRTHVTSIVITLT